MTDNQQDNKPQAKTPDVSASTAPLPIAAGQNSAPVTREPVDLASFRTQAISSVSSEDSKGE